MHFGLDVCPREFETGPHLVLDKVEKGQDTVPEVLVVQIELGLYRLLEGLIPCTNAATAFFGCLVERLLDGTV